MPKNHISRSASSRNVPRAESQGILDVAAAINEGNAEAALKIVDHAECAGVQRLVLNSSRQNDAIMAKELAGHAFNCFQMHKIGNSTASRVAESLQSLSHAVAIAKEVPSV